MPDDKPSPEVTSVVDRINAIAKSASGVLSLIALVAPTIALILIAITLQTGHLPGLTRALQGYQVAESAQIEAPVVLPKQTFADFLYGSNFKAFPGSAQLVHNASDIQGRVLVWTFHIKGYAADNYQVYFEDYGLAKHPARGALCRFQTETVADDNGVCAYFAADQPKLDTPRSLSPRDEHRAIAVWLEEERDGKVAPIAFRLFTFEMRGNP